MLSTVASLYDWVYRSVSKTFQDKLAVVQPNKVLSRGKIKYKGDIKGRDVICRSENLTEGMIYSERTIRCLFIVLLPGKLS